MSPRRIKEYFLLVFLKFSQIANGKFAKTLKIRVKINP